MRLVATSFAVLSAAAAMIAGASAQDFPNRPLRVIVPFAAGGPNDVAARLIAESLRAPLGQSVVVENRGGGGGVAGAEVVATSAPDGYTMLLGAAGPLVVSPSVKPLRYDVAKDLAPLAQVYRSAQVLAVHHKLGVKTVAEFVAYAKANPSKVNVGSAGVGTLPHLSIELMNKEAGTGLVHVPYRGTSGALTDLLGGQIEALFGDVAVLAPNIMTGKLVALAVTSPDRSSLLPDVVTMAEARFPALETESWGGLLLPAGVPADVFAKLNVAAQAALAAPAFRDGSKKQGWSDLTTSPELFGKLIQSETAKWGPLVKSGNFKID